MYKISAGNYDRHHCPVSFEADDAPCGKIAVRLENGRLLPAQSEKCGQAARVSFILEYLPAGEELCFELVPASFGDDMRAVAGEKDVRILRGGDLITRYYFGEDLAKPYLGPFCEEFGKQMTRLDFTAREHPHHRSLWFAHGSVNGVDTWNETAGVHGFIINNSIQDVVSGGVYCGFTAKNTWTDHDKKPLCDDETEIRFYNTPSSALVMQARLTLIAAYGDVTLGRTKEAGPIAVRMNDELVVGKTGRFETPTGVNEDEIWMKRAPWCDYCGTAEGHRCGVTIMDDPDNDGYPSYWHSRNYGLMAPNNYFIPGDRLIPAGQRATWRYRVFFHNGDTRKARVADRYADYINAPKVEKV